ncbi:hypothetical protein ACEN2T_17170 [Pseudomonas sp. W22_MBD1_FP4]|uniref:hypothetical protein n=1 Tax=Pseudomonas sp. W22_MBD1_FP4 TaxID=3240272 RepID=UPI003F947576
MQNDAIKRLIEAVPSASLRLGMIRGDKPGVFAGDEPICRVKEGSEGAAYAALIVGAVNALPQLLASSERPDRGQRIDANLRDLVAQRISGVLSMRPGTKKNQMSIWAKLIWTTVETVLAENLRPDLPGGECLIPSDVAFERETIHSARLAAVLEFSAMVMCACAPTEGLEAQDLESVIQDWVKSCNAQTIIVAA